LHGKAFDPFPPLGRGAAIFRSPASLIMGSVRFLPVDPGPAYADSCRPVMTNHRDTLIGIPSIPYCKGI
jgi:hypothetical protein